MQCQAEGVCERIFSIIFWCALTSTTTAGIVTAGTTQSTIKLCGKRARTEEGEDREKLCQCHGIKTQCCSNRKQQCHTAVTKTTMLTPQCCGSKKQRCDATASRNNDAATKNNDATIKTRMWQQKTTMWQPKTRTQHWGNQKQLHQPKTTVPIPWHKEMTTIHTGM